MVRMNKLSQDEHNAARLPSLLVRTPADGGGFTRGVQKRMITPGVRTGAPAPAPSPAPTPAPTPAPAPAPAPTPTPTTAAANPTPQPSPTPAPVTDPAATRTAPAGQPTVADIVAEVMRQRGAPAVHTPNSAGQRMDARSLELLALDSGMRGEDVDLWRAARNAELPAVPQNHRFRLTGGRRQFNQMRGGRQIGAGNPMLGQPTGPSEDVGALWGAYAAYMARASVRAGRCDPNLAFQMAKRDGADPILVRALGETAFVDGGALVPEIVLEDYIELLYASTVYLQGNPMRVTLTAGKITIPRLAAGASAAWIGESQAITPTQQKFDDVVLNLRKLGIVVPYSNDLANHAITALQQLVRDDMSMQGAIKVDVAMIRGDGTAFQPRGLLNSVFAGNSFAANAVLNVANVTIDIAKMMRLQMAQNIKGTKWYWMMSPRTLMYLWSARNAVNAYVWQDELNRGTFMGRPFGVTTSIPETLGAGSDSELYLVDMAHEVFGEGAGQDGYKFSVVDGAAYSNGVTTVSGYSQDESVARLIQKCDRASRQNGKNISILTGVQWQ